MTKPPRVALHLLGRTLDEGNVKREMRPASDLIDDLLFRADHQFVDYQPFSSEGAFPSRLYKWLLNCTSKRDRDTMLRLASRILYMDSRAMRSLYAESYRTVVVPWLFDEQLTIADEIREDYWDRALDRLAGATLFSVTESFHWDSFRAVNSIAGIPEPEVLGKTVSHVRRTLGSRRFGAEDVIVLEDIVGSGDQAIRALQELIARCANETRLLFIGLIGIEGCEARIKEKIGQRVRCALISSVPVSACIRAARTTETDSDEVAAIRAVVKATERRVLTRHGAHDDPPTNAFGWRGGGATLVTYRNTPNNTLPLVHHRAPNWDPLFRRIHHGGKKS